MLIALAVLGEMKVPDEVALVLSVAAFIALTAMAFVNWMQVVAFLTSFEGAILLASGMGSLMNLKPTWFQVYQDMLVQSAIFLPFAILFPAAAGYFLQMAAVHAKESGGGR